MNIVLLPGNDPDHNKEWINEIAHRLEGDFDKVLIQEYRHWKSGGRFDFDYEAKHLSETVKDFGDYVLFGKSFGVLTILKSVSEYNLQPKKCIFVGTALNAARRMNFPIETWLKSLSCPVLFIQKTNDPAGSFESLKKLVERLKLKNARFIEVPGKDHAYREVDELVDNLKLLVGR